jgi:AAA family ATP:ADP antiporter
MIVVVPAFGWISSIIAKDRLIPTIYLFFISNLLGFSFVLTRYPNEVAPFFFSWVSIFNLTTISIFWTILSDSCREDRAKVLFGPVAAGGSVGAFLGPALTSQLVRVIHVQGMVLLSAFLLLLSILAIRKIPILRKDHDLNLKIKVGDGILAGLSSIFRSKFMFAMTTLTFVGNILGTFLYFRQAAILKADVVDSIRRTEILSYIDLGVNTTSLIFQLIVTPLCLTLIPPRIAFSIIPAAICICFVALGFSSAFEVLVAAQILRRAFLYSLSKPIESLLFSVRSDEEAYKGRNAVDTFVYRLGDTTGASILKALMGGVVTPTAMFVASVVAVGMGGITYWLGRDYERTTKR